MWSFTVNAPDGIHLIPTAIDHVPSRHPHLGVDRLVVGQNAIRLPETQGR
jgi:hypothetical protein